MANGDYPGPSGGSDPPQQPPAQQPPAGQYGQPQYPQSQYPPQGGPPGGQPQKTNGMAVASLILGILWICSIGSILAVIFGTMAKKQIDASQGRETGRGLAVAGLVLGWIGIAFLIIWLILLAFGLASFEFTTST